MALNQLEALGLLSTQGAQPYMPSDHDAQPGASSGPAPDPRASAAAQARALVREAWKATLSTVARSGGHPYGSLVAVAAEPGGSPLLLLSGLAEHTKNIKEDQRASLLFDGTGIGRGALTGPRVTVVGRIEEVSSDAVRRRYLARHPDASAFIDFADFSLYALRIEWAHLVAGFGRIVRLDATDVLVPHQRADALADIEPDILAHMNTDHADAVTLLAEVELRRRGGGIAPARRGESPWLMLGCDSEGFDLASGDRAIRVTFSEPILTPDAVRKALVALVQLAEASRA